MNFLYRTIKNDILQGKIAPGQKLKEEELALKYETSRTPIREVIQKLASEGLVHHEKNRGSYVRTYEFEDIINMYNLRAQIEGYASFLAAQNAVENDIHLMEKSLADYKDILSNVNNQPIEEVTLQCVENNNDFHLLIAKASKNQEIPKVLKNLSALPIMYRGFILYDVDKSTSSLQFHASILNAIKNRDSIQAEALMRSHLLHGRDNIIKHMERTSKEEIISPQL